MTQLVVVCADLPASAGGSVSVLGGTEELVILEQGGERYACRRETGELVSLPAHFVALPEPPAAIAVADRRIGLRHVPPAVVRGAERLSVALALGDDDGAVLVPGVGAFALERTRSAGGAGRLIPTVIGPTGDLVSLSSLPVWVVNQRDKYDLETAIAWTLVYEPTARVVVIATPDRASWLAAEALGALAATTERALEVVVARAPQHPADLDYFRAERARDRRAGADTVAAAILTPAVVHRIAQLRALAVVPALSDDGAEELAAAWAERARGPAPIAAGVIIAAHLAALGGPDYLAGPRSAVRAARANQELARAGDPRRFVSFVSRASSFTPMSEPDPTFIRLAPEARGAIASAELLWLDPELPPLPALGAGAGDSDCAALVVAVIELAALAPASVAAAREGDRVRLRVELGAALELIALLPHPRELALRASAAEAPKRAALA